MSNAPKTPDLQAVAQQFLDKRVDWVAEDSMFHNTRYAAAIGLQLSADGNAGTTLESLVNLVAKRILQPTAEKLAASISEKAPELAPVLKNIDIYQYVHQPAAIDKALTRFLKEKPWHPAAEDVENLHTGLKRFNEKLCEPMDRAQAMMTRINHMASLSPSISLLGTSLDGAMERGIKGLETLGSQFLEIKNLYQDAFSDSPALQKVERAFSDADEVLRIVAEDAAKVRAVAKQVKAAAPAKPSSPPPPPHG